MADSLTDQELEQESSSQEDLLDNQEPSAEEQQEDTGSEGNEPTGSVNEESEDSEDEGLKRFAKAQGFDPENLSDGEKKALKIAHDNQKATRKEMQTKAEETRKSIQDVNSVTESELEGYTEEERTSALTNARLAQIEASQRTMEFYNRNPDARKFDKEMGEILLEEFKAHRDPNVGRIAANALARDLDRLYAIARSRKLDKQEESLRDEGRREERETQRKRQEGSADAGHARSTSSGSPKVTKDWIKDEYDPSNPEHVKMVDEAIVRGDLY